MSKPLNPKVNSFTMKMNTPAKVKTFALKPDDIEFEKFEKITRIVVLIIFLVCMAGTLAMLGFETVKANAPENQPDFAVTSCVEVYGIYCFKDN